MAGLGTLDRVAIAVRDIEGAQRLYSELLGISFDPIIEDEAAGVSVVYSRSGFEFISPREDGGPLAQALLRFMDEHGEGVNVVTVMVDDLDAAMAHFALSGIKPFAIEVVGGAREALFEPSDLFGVPLVLNECPSQHPMSIAAVVPGTRQAVGAVMLPGPDAEQHP